MKTKIREIQIKEHKGRFYLLGKKEDVLEKYDFEGISSFKQILSNEKARILDVIKYQKPSSIYELAKFLKRPFKGVFDDIKLLERYGFIHLIAEKNKNKIRHKPEIIIDQITVHIKF